MPARTPREVVMRLNREIQTIMEMPDVKKRLNDLNLNAQSSTPEQVADLLASDIKRWHEVITKAKIEKDMRRHRASGGKATYAGGKGGDAAGEELGGGGHAPNRSLRPEKATRRPRLTLA